MEETLKQLQEYQRIALRNGISCTLDVYVMEENASNIQIQMHYSSTGDVLDNRNFTTTFSNDDKYTNFKLERITKFINDIEQ